MQDPPALMQAMKQASEAQAKLADCSLKIHALAMTVRAMRQAQKNYFRDRQVVDLELSRKLEREVDGMVEQVLSPQQEMFGDATDTG